MFSYAYEGPEEDRRDRRGLSKMFVMNLASQFPGVQLVLICPGDHYALQSSLATEYPWKP